MTYRSVSVLGLWIGVALAVSPRAQAQAEETQEQMASATEPAGALEEILFEGRFIGGDASSAMKFDLPVRDIPFTIANYTGAFMEAIETTNVADLYKYMTGIQRGGNTGYDITIRGFKSGASDRNGIMVDGLPGLAARFGSPPTVNADHIELVKGPASVLYGQAQPGGFVNIITKKPQAASKAELDLRASSWSGDKWSLGDRPGYTASGDFTGPIGNQDTFLYRLVVEYADADTYRDFGQEEAVYVVPSVTWNIGDATTLTWSLEYLDTERQRDNFLVVPARNYDLLPPITTIYQQPDDTEKETGKTSSLSLFHAFSNGAAWNTSLRNVRHEDETRAYETSAIRGTTAVGRRARHQQNERSYDFLDTNVALPFATGAVEHKLLVGINGGREVSEFNRLQFFNAPAPGTQLLCGTTPAAQMTTCGTTDPQFTTLTRNQGSLDVDIYNPSHTVNLAGSPILPLDALPPGPGLNDRRTTSTSYGVYLSDMLALSEHWKAMAGLRYAREKQDFEEQKLAGVPDSSKTVDDILPMAGLLFQPNDELSFYTSYSTSFVPPDATALDTSGNNSFDPETAQQVEVGAKVELSGGRSAINLALFKIERENVLSTFGVGDGCPPIVGTCTRQNGKEQSQGVELEVNTQLTETWQIAIGYTYTDTEIVETDEVIQQGSRLINAPLHNAHFWSRYDFVGPLEGFGIGLGVAYSSYRLGILPTSVNPTAFEMPGYTTADLGLYYVRDRYSATLRVSNLLDKYYIETGGFSGQTQIQPGTPRNVALSFKVDLF